MLSQVNYTQNELNEIINSIALGVSSSSGEMFFEKLVLHLWDLYQMEYISVGVFDKESTVVQTLKFCVKGEIVDNITYSMKNTPCEQIINDKSAVYTKNVQEHFADDLFFQENSIESYLGIRLVDTALDGIGIISCLDSKEISNPNLMHSVLEIFASRASAEIERIQKEEALEKSIVNRTKELSYALEKIQAQAQVQLLESEKMAALGSMVSGFTHDLNTPIGVSVMASTYLTSETKEMMKKVKEGNLTKSALDEFLQDSYTMSNSIYKNLYKSRELIKSFKLISIDQHIQDEKTFLLMTYLDDIVLSLHYVLKHSHVKINNHINASIELHTSGGMFFQIFSNLILNSIKHGFEKQEAGQIDIDASYEGGHLILNYKDNGQGMSKEIQEKVFIQFFTTKKDDGGTGLGMFTVHELVVKRLGGKIELITEPNQGVEFIIDIPLAPHDSI